MSRSAAADGLVPAPGRVRVVVVEDSVVQRAHLVDVLEADGDIEVVGEAATAREAIGLVAALRPHVVTLDLNIPEGGGHHALEQIMANTPTPVLVLSSTVSDDSSVPAVEALVAGALLALPKPTTWTPTIEHDLRRHVRTIRNVPVIRHPRGRLRNAQTLTPAPSSGLDATTPGGPPCVVAIAASTGGPPALATVVQGLAGVGAPVLVVQHIHPEFVDGLVRWLDKVAPVPVVVARHGDRLLPGRVHVGPGGHHLGIVQVGVGRELRVALTEDPTAVHCPSADHLFASVAECAGSRGVGVLLTGMGDDGATGLAAMRRRGAHTIAQDEATSAVYGMPREAVRLGAVTEQLPIDAVADAIVRATHHSRKEQR